MADHPAPADELLRRLPLPLAQLYRRAHNAKSPRDSHDCAVYLWKAALKLLAGTAVVTTAASGPPSAAVAERLRSLARPSLGHWREFVRLLVPDLAARPGFKAIADLLDRPRADLKHCIALDAALRAALGQKAGPRQTVQVNELFDRIVEYRNKGLAHGAPAARQSALFRPLADLLLAAAEELFARLDVLAGQRLVTITEVRPVRGTWLVERIELHGVVPWRVGSLELPRVVGAGPPFGEGVYLSDPDRPDDPAALVPLHPLVVFDAESETVLFLNSRRGRRRVELLCYATGRTVDLPDAGAVPCELLARVLGVNVSKSDAETWAVASQAEDRSVEPEVAPSGGRRLGDYEIIGELGRGGMGIVYRAWQPALGRTVALKVQPRPGDVKADARFRREVRALARVDHPHLVKVYTSGFDEEQFYYAMELVEGAPLAAVCDALTRAGGVTTAVDLTEWRAALGAARQSPAASPRTIGAAEDSSPGAPLTTDQPDDVPPTPTLVQDVRVMTGGRGYVRRIAALMQQVTEAAHALHEAGVLHRDIKPGNVLVTADGEQAVLMDLGLAQLADDTEGRLTRTRQFVGTLRYASPQQVLAVGTLDRRGDIYSIGATLWELLTLQPLFGATANTPTPELMERIQRDEPQRLRRMNSEVGRDLEAIVHKCLEKDPERRYATARDLADDLGRWLAGEPVIARPVRGWERGAKWVRRRPLLAGLSTALLTAIVYATVSSWVLAAQAKLEAKRANDEAVKARTERNAADEQRRRMQSALDDMLSEESLAFLTTQKELLPQQKAFLERSLDYYREFAARAANDAEGRALIASAHIRVGRILKTLGRRPEADSSFREARALYKQLAIEFPDAADYRRSLGQTHTHLGKLLDELGRQQEAEVEYRAALVVQSKLAADHPRVPVYRHEQAISHSSLGWLLGFNGRQSEAEPEMQAALTIQERLVAEDSTVADYRRELAQSHSNLSWLLNDLKRPHDALKQMQKSLALRERLASDFPDFPDYRAELAVNYQGQGLLLNKMGKREDADSAFRSSLALRERLAAEFPGAPHHALALGTSYYNYGEVTQNRGDSAAAHEWFAKSIAVLEPIHRADPRHAVVSVTLCYAHWGEAIALDNLGRSVEAVAKWERALQLDPGGMKNTLRIGRAGSFARSGAFEKALVAAEELAATPDLSVNQLYDVACVFALAAAKSSPREGESAVIRAVDTLRKAVARGYKDVENFKKDSDFEPLRNREDFKQLLKEMEKNLQPVAKP